MIIHLDLRNDSGVLFCGSVDAPSTVAALTLKLEELRLTGRGRRRGRCAPLRIEAERKEPS